MEHLADYFLGLVAVAIGIAILVVMRSYRATDQQILGYEPYPRCLGCRILFLSFCIFLLVCHKAYGQTIPADNCGNTDARRGCLYWTYPPLRRDNIHPFSADQVKNIFIVYQDQSPRIISGNVQQFITAPCVKGEYYIYIEDFAGYISDWSNKVFMDTTKYCSPPPAPKLSM